MTRVADETLEHGEADRGVALPRFAPGTTIGHFRILRELGAGGMGIVLEAYDADLDRNVAIKVVRDRGAGTVAGDRLVREAQAMARLGHPNVVPVHEVGTIDGQVFVVMELVRGDTLGRWLEAPRSWRDVVRAFVQAGEGLEAAHRAGLVHRDFKPSNVLVDSSGHVRVGDFGLARDDSDPGDRPRFADGTDPTRPAGTPAYMAPEQHAGETVDARADQYSFAISLERALAAETALDKPPRRVRAAIARALAVDPEARFARVGELLAELRRALDARRRAVVAISTGLAVAAATTAIASWAMRPATDDCADGAQLVDAVWNAHARDAQAAKFSALRPSLGAATASTASVVDHWTDAWRLGRRGACRAEPAQRPGQLSCLDRDLGALRAQLSVWADADTDVVDRAVTSAAGLPDPALCAIQTGGAASPVARALDDRAAAVDAEDRGGRAARIKPKLAALVADADASHDAAAQAHVLRAVAEAERSLGDLAAAHDHIARAAIAAGRASDDVTLFYALASESVITTDLGRPRDGLGLLDAAEAVAERAHLDRAARIAGLRGDELAQAGELPQAIETLQRALELTEARAAHVPAARAELSTVIGELAGAYVHTYDFAKAHELLLRSLALDEAEFGEHHPEIAKTLHDLADTEVALGKIDDALARDRRARQIFVDAYGEHSLMVAATDLSVAGITLTGKGDDAAEPLYLQARAELEQVVPADHPYLGVAEEALGSIARDRDRCKDAIPHFQRALAITERAGTGGTDHAMDLTNLGACLLDVGRKAEARTMLERALAEHQAAGVAPRDRSEDMGLLAELDYADGNHARAIVTVRAILQILGDNPGPPYDQLVSYERGQLAKWTNGAK